MSKVHLFTAIFQIIVGILAIVAYIILAGSGEPIAKWTVTLALAVLFVIRGSYKLWNIVKNIKKK